MRHVALLAATALGLSGLSAGGPAFAQDPGDSRRMLIGYHSSPSAQDVARAQQVGAVVRYVLPEALAVEADGPVIAELARQRNVLYVEPDAPRYAQGLSDAELAPALGNGLYGLVTTRSTEAQQMVTGAGVKACVADTGLQADHPDIGPVLKGAQNFVKDGLGVRGDASETHGTHVAGTVAGHLGQPSGAGVRGVAYGADLYYARVLGPNGGSSSDIMAGVQWLVDRGCKVVNLSLGGGLKSRTEESFYKRMSERANIVAAAGNDSARTLSYPAGYPVVISVGAVDVNNNHASFSNTGKGLDLSAPGVDVLSSVPTGSGREAGVLLGDTEKRAFGLEYSGTTAGRLGLLVDCGLATTTASCAVPQGVQDFVAVVSRGEISFADKVRNVTAQGADAAVIYNNVDGDFTGTLGSAGSWIPAVAVARSVGTDLLARPDGTSATVVNKASDWDHYSGTSMASPHVAGVAALVWQARGASGTPADVESILKSTAADLGATGTDATYGAGLVNALAAVNRATGQ